MENKPAVAPQPKNEIDSAITAGASIGKPKDNPNADGGAYAILPPGHSLAYLDRPQEPFRRKGVVKMSDADSFCRIFGELADADSRIYGFLDGATFVAVLNDDHVDAAGWRDHRAVYKLEHSAEWKMWIGKNKSDFSGNDAFAIWLEDNAIDIIEPSAASMMDIALNMRVSQSQGFAKALRLQDGSVQFTYSNEVNGQVGSGEAGHLMIPESFKIQIPVFAGLRAPKYELEAKFRYRLASGQLHVRYELVRPHKVIDAAFEDLIAKIERDTGKTVFFGSPE